MKELSSASPLPGPLPQGGRGNAFVPRHVIGLMLSTRSQVAALGDAVSKAPYKAPPSAPVLSLKPPNTWRASGEAVEVPREPGVVTVSANLGVVLVRDARRLSLNEASAAIRGYVLVCDLSLPLPAEGAHYRPAVRQRCRDGFCPMSDVFQIGDGRVEGGHKSGAHPTDDCILETRVNGNLVHRSPLSDLVRSFEQALVDVSEFMTLKAGDVLYAGAAANPPLARIGDTVSVSLEGYAKIETPLIAEAI